MNRHDYRAHVAISDTIRAERLRLQHPNRIARTPALKPKPRAGFRRWSLAALLSGGAA